jgi:hypothetical protein
MKNRSLPGSAVDVIDAAAQLQQGSLPEEVVGSIPTSSTNLLDDLPTFSAVSDH